MKIVIAGAGEMGSHLARMLSGNGHDITVIDADQKLLSEVGSLADVICVEGDSTTFAVLRKVVLEIPALFILNWLFPLYGLAYAQMCAEIVLSVAAIFVLTRLFRRLKASSAPIL